MNAVKYIVAGLGNPGKEYDKTRHNVGFMALDFIASKLGTQIECKKFKSLCGISNFEENKVLLLKPQTYMNLSGEALVEAMNFYKIPSERVIVIFDDVSLPLDKIRIRKKGSHGGHNGIKNIILLSGTENFPRIKIGVGENLHPNRPLADWVLSKFSDEEYKILNNKFKDVYEAANMIIHANTDAAMNKYN